MCTATNWFRSVPSSTALRAIFAGFAATVLLGSAAQAGVVSFPLDSDGNNDGSAPVQVNSGGGVHLKNGQLSLVSKTADPNGGYDYDLGNPLAQLAYDQYSPMSSARTFDWRFSLIAQDLTGTWHTVEQDGWNDGGVTVSPGGTQDIGDTDVYLESGWAQLYATFEAKTHGTSDSGPFTNGVNYGWIHTGDF